MKNFTKIETKIKISKIITFSIIASKNGNSKKLKLLEMVRAGFYHFWILSVQPNHPNVRLKND
jgi:hypothetical protein